MSKNQLGDLDVAKIFRAGLTGKASDIHLTAGSPPIFRINGDLAFAKMDPLNGDQIKRALYELLSHEQVVRFEKDKELDFSIHLEGATRFRGNAYLQRGNIGAAFRLIPTEIPKLENLGLPPVIEDLALSQQGLLLVTGPTGHGKSTTQAAMLGLINERRRCHIITVEDPIEFIHKNRNSVIEQREVGEDTHSFGKALRHVLRQDPDVILVGEMRDLETIEMALTAAETGHLVVSTLHTNDSVQSIDRIIDVFPAHQQGQIRAQLSMSLKAVFAQRLLQRKNKSGMLAAVEILIANDAVRHLIRDSKVHQIYTIMQTHSKLGMVTMDAVIKELYQNGEISHEEARRNMGDPRGLDEL